MTACRVAVLLTCHNRREKTLQCLRRLDEQHGDDVTIDVVVLDAASSDGTAETIRRAFPHVTVLDGPSDMFWNAGMRVAFLHAVTRDYDYYLWVNDDTVLDPGAVQMLIDTERAVAASERRPAIVAGSTRDPVTGRLTYGGVHRPHRRRRLRFELLALSNAPQECETMNGNCVLVPRSVVRRIGVLDAAYSHGFGDFDYGLQARRAGLSVWVAPGTVGTCTRNVAAPPATSARAELQRLRGPKGLPPRDWVTFSRRWGGTLWPLYAASPYLRRLARTLRP